MATNNERETMTATVDQIARTQRDWSEYAGEQLKVEQVGGAIYAFGSELGCRRLAHFMRSFHVKYSENLRTWFFCQELKS